MLGCPHCEHQVWSTDAWTKHIHTHYPGLPMLVEVKMGCVTPEESEEVLAILSASQI